MRDFNSKWTLCLVAAFVAPFIPQSESVAAPGVSSDVSEQVSADVSIDEDSEARWGQGWGQGIGQHQGLGKGGKGGKPMLPRSIEVCNDYGYDGPDVRVATLVKEGAFETIEGWTVVSPFDCKMVIVDYTGPGRLYAHVEDFGGNEMTGLILPEGGCVDPGNPSFVLTESDACDPVLGLSFEGFAKHPNITPLWTITVP